jgi:hypothetical protein
MARLLSPDCCGVCLAEPARLREPVRAGTIECHACPERGSMDRRLCCACGLAAMLSGCGGGDGAATAPAEEYDAFAAWRGVLATRHTWSARGTGSDGRRYTVTIDAAPGGTGTFPVTGAAAARSIVMLVTDVDGVAISGTQETWHDPTTLRVVGLSRALTGGTPTCDVATVALSPPAAAQVNTSGTLARLDELDGCDASSTRAGTITLTWSLEFEPDIVWFCVNSTERDPADLVVSFEGDCVETAPDGTLGTAVRITVQQAGGFTLVAR